MDLQKLFEEASDLRNNGQTEEAVEVYQKVIGQALQKDDRKLAAQATQMIGSSYYINKEYDKADDYFLEALDLFKSLRDDLGQGSVLRDLGMNAQKQKDYEKAKDYLHNSIYHLKQTDNLGHLGMSQVKLGLLYSEMGENDKAEESILEGIKNIEQSPDDFFHSTAYFDLAKLQKKVKKTDKAKNSVQKALEILDKISNREQFVLRRKEMEEFLVGLGAD